MKSQWNKSRNYEQEKLQKIYNHMETEQYALNGQWSWRKIEVTFQKNS
jgi:hypothetical protein